MLCKEAFYGKDLILADRDMVETESDDILRDADTQNVSLLVVGDPFGWAVHTNIGMTKCQSFHEEQQPMQTWSSVPELSKFPPK